MIHMDNSFTGVHSYTAEEWTYNGDGTVSIGALSYEGDPPKTENAGRGLRMILMRVSGQFMRTAPAYPSTIPTALWT